MQPTFQRVLSELEGSFRRLEAQVPGPQPVPYQDGFVLRYREKTPRQALIQKFARQISGLHALDLLLTNGFLQEQGVIQRTLDDVAEDILFLTLGIATGNWTEHHEKYLEYFWAEEAVSGVPRGQVKRDKIRAYNHRTGGLENPSSANDAGRQVYKAYSGYVHAASENVVDMCVGNPPRYLLSGMLESPLYADHVDDAWNYFYRGLMSSVLMAKSFEDSELWGERFHSLKGFEAAFADKIFKTAEA